MAKMVQEGSLVELELLLRQGDPPYPSVETEMLYGFQSVLPALDEAIKDRREGEKFEIPLSPKDLRRWKKTKIDGIDFSQNLTVEVFIKKVKQPSAEELLAMVRQLFSCQGSA